MFISVVQFNIHRVHILFCLLHVFIQQIITNLLPIII